MNLKDKQKNDKNDVSVIGANNLFKKIYIYMFEYNGVGGTVTYVNILIEKMIASGFPSENINIITKRYKGSNKEPNVFPKMKLKNLEDDSLLIITRESFFVDADLVKNEHVTIVGEIHSAIYRFPELNLNLERLDAIKTNNQKNKEYLENSLGYNRVFNAFNPITSKKDLEEIVPQKTDQLNFYNATRFSENSKNIFYTFQILKEIKDRGLECSYYLQGMGESVKYYKLLIDYMDLKDVVVMVPPTYQLDENLILLNTSRVETFGYTIVENVQKECVTITTVSDDNRYLLEDLESILFIGEDVVTDVDRILEFVGSTKVIDFKKDILKIEKRIDNDNYFTVYLNKLTEILKQEKSSDLKEYTYLKSEKNLDFSGVPFKKLVPKKIKVSIYDALLKTSDKYQGINENVFFIETFHGKSWSGDPKILINQIKKDGSTVYVSSENSLVDTMIINDGFIPVRMKSAMYYYAAQTAETLIINGNLIDTITTNEKQKVIQTWHGFPLKKMVHDLNNDKERKHESARFDKRKQKWTHFVSTPNKEVLLNSAFKLEKLKLNKIALAPISWYLNKYQNDQDYLVKLKQKYKIDPNKKTILFSPTWRKGNDENFEVFKNLETLTEEYNIIVKFHPLEKKVAKYRKKYQGLKIDYPEYQDINELLLIADTLVTDYSSILFDYSILKRKIVVYTEDVKKYSEKIGFYFKTEDLGIEEVIQTPEKLIEVLKKEQTLVDSEKLFAVSNGDFDFKTMIDDINQI